MTKSHHEMKDARLEDRNAGLKRVFRAVAASASDAIIATDDRGKILFANPATERTFGRSVSEIVGREITILMPEYLHEPYRAALVRYLKTGRKSSPWNALELKGLHQSGKELPLEISIGEHVTSRTRIFTGVIRDISSRRDAAEELRQSEEKYAKMIQSSPDAITLRTLPERRYMEINEGFTRLTGYTPEEVIGKTPAELDIWVEERPHREVLEKLDRTGEVREKQFLFRTKNGEIRHARVSAKRVSIGGQLCMLSVSHDITDRIQAEESLLKSRSRFRSLIQDAPFAIYRATLAGKFLALNPAMVKMLGYSSEAELMERGIIADVYRDPEFGRKLVAEYWACKEFKDVEAGWKRKDGEVIAVRMSGRWVENEEDREPCLEVFAEDVTERRSLERQILQIQRMEAVGQLAGGIAHDFNNLLSVILGQIEILKEQLSGNESLFKRAETIKHSASRAADLTRQLLAFSRKQVIEPRILDLNASIRNTEMLLRPLIGEDVELVLRPEARMGLVKADPAQLEQVFINLAVNARDAMPQGGKLIVETANVEVDEVYVRQHPGARAGQFVMVSVSDTGVGMDATTMAHVFEPFFTTKEPGKGTGLGLSTVYGIVKQNGGYLMTYSEPGQGTTFKIYFPRFEKVSASVEIIPAGEEFPKGRETILVVEDEPALRELVRELLEASGYEVLEASGAEEAIRLIENPWCTIHLLLTDVVMPEMDGRKLATRLQQISPDLHVLYMSGYTDDVIARRGVLNPNILLLSKPFTRSVLLQKVREALSS
ncbi:MAG: PAS domain S-box protein [Candidatus Acidiferrales bacterium]